MFIIIIIAIFLIPSSYILTYAIKSYAEKKLIIDIPNQRSSHTLPTPRGGGLTFVLIFLSAILIFKYFSFQGLEFRLSEILSLSILALLGFYDDKNSLSPSFRLGMQLVAVVILLIYLPPLPALPINFFVINTEIILKFIIGFYLLWLINLYNFMDGINGIASIEAITVCLGMSFVYWLTNETALVPKVLIIAAIVLGFLPWNFPKAKIFMGDVGSNFLGLLFGILSLQAFFISRQLFWSWLILLGVFITDSSITLMRRGLHGEKIYQAHCNHAYQNAARKIGSHIPVTLFVLVVNITWLLPLAGLVALQYLNGFIGLLIAYLPLCGLVFALQEKIKL